MYIKKFQKTSLDMFKTHYNTFKPSLDEIKNFKAENLQSVDGLREFIVRDSNTLFQLPFNNESRVAFYREIDNVYPNLQNLSKFNDLAHALSRSNDPSIIHASVYFREEQSLLRQTFCESRVWGHNISRHPDYETVTTIMARQLESCNDVQLNTLLCFSDFYEKIALVTLEPWMISVLGNLLFFKLFVPLHYTGAFHTIVEYIVQKVKSARITFSTIFQNYSNRLLRLQVLKPIFPLNATTYFIVSNLINLAYSYVKSNFLTLSDQRQAEKNSATRVVDKYMNFNERGINNTSYQAFVSNIARISFEIGRFWGTIPRNILDGALSRYEDLFRSAAQEYDNSRDPER